MMLWLCVLLAGTISWLVWRYMSPDRLRHIPGPTGLPVFRNTLQVDRTRTYLSFHRWAKKYGAAYRLGLPIGDVIVVSDYNLIHQVLVTNGNKFAGRSKTLFDISVTYSVVTIQPGDTWRHIRKLSHRYMKQFGDGMSRLEELLLKNVDYMLSEFDSSLEKPLNTLEILRNTALRSVSVLLLGRALETGEPLLDLLLKFERDFVDLLKMSVGKFLLMRCPWMINFPSQTFAEVRNFKRLEDECWQKVKESQLDAEAESLANVLLSNLEGYTNNTSAKQSETSSPIAKEIYAKGSSLALIFAGVATTSRAMYFILNTISFRKDIQQHIYSEITSVLSDERVSMVTVNYRSKMPYLRATILECLRAFTVAVSGGQPHAAVSDVELPGYGIIPKGTLLLINSWTLHHDEDFWQDPDEIRPERFLDEDGNLVPPDHPNRKHLLPFGAGPRVCLGEVFAMTRLFLWTAAVVRKFEMRPAPGSDAVWMNPNSHHGDVVLSPLPNDVIFSRRT